MGSSLPLRRQAPPVWNHTTRAPTTGARHRRTPGRAAAGLSQGAATTGIALVSEKSVREEDVFVELQDATSFVREGKKEARADVGGAGSPMDGAGPLDKRGRDGGKGDGGPRVWEPATAAAWSVSSGVGGGGRLRRVCEPATAAAWSVSSGVGGGGGLPQGWGRRLAGGGDAIGSVFSYRS
ncbi:hypothetical protein ACQJBY_020798 [Aegilops geniculata]